MFFVLEESPEDGQDTHKKKYDDVNGWNWVELLVSKVLEVNNRTKRNLWCNHTRTYDMGDGVTFAVYRI